MAIEIKPGDNDISEDPSSFEAVAPTEPVEDSPEETEYVEYKGNATLRRITSEQFEQAGVSGHPTVEWSKSNNYRVDVDDLSPEALEVLRKDGSFSVPARNSD